MGAETRKAAARQWNENHKNLKAKKVRKSLGDNPDEDIPKHGPRANTSHRLAIDARLSYSRALAKTWAEAAHQDDWLVGIGTTISRDKSLIPIVVDTDVIVRAIGSIKQSDCQQIVNLCITGDIKPCVTKPMVIEYRRVVGRRVLKDGSHFDENSDRMLAELLARCLIFIGQPQRSPLPVSADWADRKFLVAQALVLESEEPCYVVTRDGHLLNLPYAYETNIMHPAKFLELMITHGLLALQ